MAARERRAALLASEAPPSDAPTLEYDAVTLAPTWPYDTAFDAVSFSIRPGELMFLTLAPGHVRSPVADLTQGLLDPHGGAVRVLGASWATLRSTDAARLRVRVGRVFDVGGWVSNLDVDENVLVAQRHHRIGSTVDLRRRADELCRTFGLKGLLTVRPANASQHELRVSQWARALFGEPSLLVLERPTRDVRPESIPPFLEAIAAARRRGAAVLWQTTAGAAAGTPHNIVPPDVTAHYSVRGTSLVRQ